MKILVSGGAGYIGSHIVLYIKHKTQHEVVVLDNFSTGHVESVAAGVPVERGDIRDVQFLDDVFTRHAPDAVMHFAASIVVPESCADPLSYYDNNVVGVLRLLQTMHKHNTKYIIFSSTAAVFGLPENATARITEESPMHPVNPYGQTKLATEDMFKWCDAAYGLRYVCLRYFNACGAAEQSEFPGVNIGEDHHPETHLIPVILQVALGKREKIMIYGDDYNTKDGSCVRDYVHVIDLATAHIKAVEYLAAGGVSNQFNLGSGEGFTVKEVVEACRKVTGHPIPASIAPRREGDPDSLVASSAKAERVLGWVRKYATIDQIIQSAWSFHVANPNGYSK